MSAKSQRGESWFGGGLRYRGIVVVGALSLLVALSKANVSIDNFGRKHCRRETRWLVWSKRKENKGHTGLKLEITKRGFGRVVQRET